MSVIILYARVTAILNEERSHRVNRWLGKLGRAIDLLNQAIVEFQDKNSAITKFKYVCEPVLQLLKNLITFQESGLSDVKHHDCDLKDIELMRISVAKDIAEIDKVVARMRQITMYNKVMVLSEHALKALAPMLLPSQPVISKPAVRNTQEMSRRMLPIKLRNSTYNAIADSGSGDKIIEESLVHELGSSIEDKTSTGAKFTNARGDRMHSIGTCRIPCSFPGDSGTYSIVFHVFKKLVTPLIMGRKFLDETKTLSRFPERLERLLTGSSEFLRVLHMEIPRRMLKCSVDGQDTLVTPDSGSEADLVSLHFARRMGNKISRSDRDQQHLLFADGEVVTVNVTVINVKLDLSSAKEPRISSKRTTLHVLPGLTSDILLGGDTLEHREAFTTYQKAFVDVGIPEYHSPLQYIAWYTRAEEKIKHAFTKISQRVSSRSTPSNNTSELQPESTYHRLVSALDEPTAKEILLQGMTFEKHLQSYDHRESQREEERAKRIGRLRGDARDAAIAEEDLAKRRACDGRKLAVRKYEEALAKRLAGR